MNPQNGAHHTELPDQIPDQLGRYRLIRPIGKGGMGVVYEATHIHLERRVALKVLRHSLADNKHFLERFYREIRALGKVLNNTHVILATDGGEESGIPFLTMEYVDGVNLDQLLRDHGGVLPVSEACELMRQAALGLDAIHEHHLVHRDLKPTNLMLTPDGIVKILDLGLVRLHEEGEDHLELTPTFGILGTLDYQAPEQAVDARKVDIRADIYSLGCTFFKLLAGEPPYGQYDRYQKMDAHAAAPIPPLPATIPEGVRAIVTKMLAKKAEDRYQTPRDVAAALAPFARGTPSAGVTRDAPANPLMPTPAPVSTPVNSAVPTVAALPEKTPAGHSTIDSRGHASGGRRWIAIAVAVAFLLTASAVAAFLVLRPDPEPSVVDSVPWNLDEIPLLQTRFLLERAPGPVLWKPDNPLASFQHTATERKFAVTVPAGEQALFQLGNVSAASYELQLRIAQPAWTSGIGIYLGYRRHEKPIFEGKSVVLGEFQLIHLSRTLSDPDKGFLDLRLERSQCKHFRKPDGSEFVQQARKISDKLPDIFNERTVTLTVVDRRLKTVHVERCQPLNAIVSSEANKMFDAALYQGEVGIWISGSQAVFRDAAFRLLKK